MNVTKKYILAIVSYVLCLIVSMFVLFTSIQNQIVINSREILTNNMDKQTIHLKSILDMHFQYLNQIAVFVGKEDNASSQYMDMLKSISNNTDLGRIAFITPEGTAYYDDGNIKNVANREYFKNAMDGKQTLSDPLESSVDKKTKIIFSVPVYHENEIIGALAGSYDVTKISHMLFDDLFDGQGYSLILDSSGNIIAQSDEITINSNTIFSQNSISTKRKKILRDFKKKKKGFVVIEGSEKQYFCYAPSGYNDWMIGYVVPIQAAQSTFHFFTLYSINILIGFILLTSILLIYIIYLNKKEHKSLSQEAHIDALTQLYNKNYTQQAIDYYLKENSEQSHCFIILDLDNFKSINDTYGHLAGDIVLTQIGKILKSHFMENDIIGRIGGDEFVVFIKEAKSEDVIKEALHQLIQDVHETKINEIKTHTLSISAGACFSPKFGNDFMHLYKKADRELYKIKMTTKNGISIAK